MLVYLTRRIALAVSVILAAICATFALFFLGPSDPAQALCGQRNCTPVRIAEIERSLQLDRPKVEQFTGYLKGIVAGRDFQSGGIVKECPAPCLGWSYGQNRPVTTIVLERLPVTASIVIGGTVVYVVFGLLFGVLAARYRGRLVDRVIVGISQTIPSIPYYILALLFALYFMVLNPILPRSSYTPLTENPLKWVTGLFAVWMFYGLYQSTAFVRYVRASMIESQAQDFVRTARSKGISERSVAVKHALRAAIAPFMTLVGLNVAADMGGAIFTERVFDIKGMGQLALGAFANGDLPIIAGTVVIGATFVTIMNIVVDLLYGVVDPRVKLT